AGRAVFYRSYPSFSEVAAMTSNEEPRNPPPDGQATLPFPAEPSASLVTVSPSADQPPRAALARIGDYEILDELGRGGMGAVYQARHIPLQGEVALKLIRAAAGADEQELVRFRLEATAVARLKHPHIVPIHDFGEHDGQLFCCLEFV